MKTYQSTVKEINTQREEQRQVTGYDGYPVKVLTEDKQ